MSTHFLVKRRFYFDGTHFRQGEVHALGAHKPTGPEHPQGVNCWFGESEKACAEKYNAWLNSGYDDSIYDT